MASFPRSGNTFLRTLLFHLYGVPTYSIHGDHLFDALKASETIGHQPLSEPLEVLDSDSQIHFVKTHQLPSDHRPAIYIVRDGRACLTSFARYKMEFEPRSRWEKMSDAVSLRHGIRTETHRRLESVIVDTSEFGGWSGNVLAWLGRDRGPLCVVRYEDLVSDPLGGVRQAVAEVAPGLQAVSSSFPTFEELNARWPAFFRKGRVDSWKEELTEDLHDLFWTHHQPAMQRLGYER